MPQLMPLYWVFSVAIIIFLIMIVFILYYNKDNLMEGEMGEKLNLKIYWLW